MNSSKINQDTNSFEKKKRKKKKRKERRKNEYNIPLKEAYVIIMWAQFLVFEKQKMSNFQVNSGEILVEVFPT